MTKNIKIVFQNEKGFITDLYGKEVDILDTQKNEVIGKLPRYGVWTCARRGKYEVAFTTNDLEEAKAKLEEPNV